MNDTQQTSRTMREEFSVAGNQVVDRVKEIVAKGNARSVKVKHNRKVVAEFPLTVGVVGTLLAPQMAVLGALAALLTQCSIEVVRTDQPVVSG